MPLCLSLCAWEELGAEPVSELGLCHHLLWAAPKAGALRAFPDPQNEAAQCSMSHIHTVCWQREHVLISWGCQGNTSSAQAPQKGTDQDNPRLLPGLEQ